MICIARTCTHVLPVLAVWLTLCTPAAAQSDIVIGSKKFPESRLLGEIMAQLVEQNTSLQVGRRFGLASNLCAIAVQNGEVDLYVEYTGTGLLVILKEELGAQRDSDAVYRRVKEQFDEQLDLLWLKPLGFYNSYALAVRPELNIRTISELEAIKDKVHAGFNYSFLEREDGYPGLIQHYGFQLPDVKGVGHGLAYTAIAAGDINLMEAYATDGMLKKFELTLLEDDKRFFPPYNAAPVLRKDTAAEFPELVPLINRLAGRLDQQTMLRLNYQVEVEERPIPEVAREFLISQQLISANSAAPLSTGMSLMKLVPLIAQHLKLTLVATSLATIVGIGLGLIVVRRPRLLAGPTLGAVGVLQTIPSLALLALFIPLMGLGERPAILALFLYSLLPIVRNTYTGLTSVPGELVEAGRGMGMTERQLLFQLKLPLAMTTIMAGVRTALVISVGTATIAAFVGAGGLGEPIITGLDMQNRNLILWGAIPAACLALLCDGIMALVQRWVEPRGLRLDS